MARVRQARRCGARRSDGRPCRAWAVLGAEVCRAHGGAAPQVRRAAAQRLVEADVRRAAEAAYAWYLAAWARWQRRRVLAAAELLGVPADQVHVGHLVWCQAVHGLPCEPEPRITDWRDRRYRAVRALSGSRTGQ